jgi:acetolactate synthase-1/2/3 large subunit
MTVRTGARLLVDQLLVQGVNHVFCVPGASCLPVLDALRDSRSIRLVVNRHESGSAYMAEAYARLTGQPGVALVSGAAAAASAAVGVHAAFEGSTPMVLFVAQAAAAARNAFEEVEGLRLFGPISKAVAKIDAADRIPETVAHAFQLAASGRPGPVVLTLPEDVLEQVSEAPDAGCHEPVQAAPSDTQLAALQRLLGRAQRPIVVVGGSGWTAAACDNLKRWTEANHLPVACAHRRQDLFDNRHANYCGELGAGANPALLQRLRNADLVLAIGPRLSELSAGREAPPQQALLHVHPGVEQLGRGHRTVLAICSGMPQFASRLAMMPPIESPPWQGELAAARAVYETWQRRPAVCSEGAPGIDLWQVVQELKQALPGDAILTLGAGAHCAWLQRFYRHEGLGTQLAPAADGSGYGVPAGIAAKLVAPERTVVAVSGDGDFLAAAHELATAVLYRLGLLVIVLNNGMYGAVRMQQERRFPGRAYGADLANPDFAQLAAAFGVHGSAVASTEGFGDALAQALAYTRQQHLPALIELRCDPELIAPDATLSAIRATARLRM